MRINLNKLQNQIQKRDGSIQAQCPACAYDGGDNKGEHLIVYPDGRFGCVVNPEDKAHNRQILSIVGVEIKVPVERRVTVRPYKATESALIADVPRFTLEELGLTEQVEPEPNPSFSVSKLPSPKKGGIAT